MAAPMRAAAPTASAHRNKKERRINHEICYHYYQHGSGKQLSSGSVPGDLPLPRSFQRSGQLHGSAVTWPIQQLLNKFGIGYLQTVVFILVIAALVQLVEMFMKKSMPALYKSLGIFLPLITTNCAVLGVCITNIDSNYNYIESLVNAFGAGVGFLFAMIIMAGVRTKLVDQSRIPESFRGVPIVLITAAILSLSFMGFNGMFS